MEEARLSDSRRSLGLLTKMRCWFDVKDDALFWNRLMHGLPTFSPAWEGGIPTYLALIKKIHGTHFRNA
jgi:hypothetical protein